MHDKIWQPVTLGDVKLEHRLVMAPMTRNRSTPEGVPTGLNATYYAQRAADAALIITEGVQPSADGQGYLNTPGVHTDDQVAGWRQVTDAVHEAGGKIFIQLMHVGRMGHPANTPHGRTPVAPSAVRAAGTIVTASGPAELPVPRALTTAEVAGVVGDFRRAAAGAIAAGADGVEIHGGNGYLVHQFLAPNTNLRTDEYGGSLEKRARFAFDVAEAVAAEIGAGRTGIRLAPGNPFNDMSEPDPKPLYEHLTGRLAGLNLAYLHVVHNGDEETTSAMRAAWPHAMLVNRARTEFTSRLADFDTGLADAISVGALHIANPDLATRLRSGAELNTPDPATFYGGDSRGYTDYPAL
ncbi:N-ethylmaleimide reductase [Mycobacterium tuberculosis]|nr:N-ethylmaleimide reductase [Mycobacterium tuberculosis]